MPGNFVQRPGQRLGYPPVSGEVSSVLLQMNAVKRFEGDPNVDANDYDWTWGHSSRVSFPGQPGYIGVGDKPSAVPYTMRTLTDYHKAIIEENGKDNSKTRLSKVLKDPTRRTYQPGENQSWEATAGQRMYNSPRFWAASNAVMEQNPEKYWRTVNDWENIQEASEADFDDYDAFQAQHYWKAHQMVQRGDFDHIEDPYQDAVNVRDRTPMHARDPKSPEARRWRPVQRKDGSRFVNKTPSIVIT